MMSRKRQGSFIFDYERPETPTSIRGSFSLGHNDHETLVASDSLEGIGITDHDGNNNSPLPVTPTDSRTNANNLEIPYEDEGTVCSVLITEFEALTPAEQLPLAQGRIKELEKRLEIVERELRLSQERAKKLASQGTRIRRMARSGDLFRRAPPAINHDDYGIDDVSKSEPLRNFITVTISSISLSREAASDAEENSRPPSVPLYLRRFEGQVFAICPRGATIGSSQLCGICIPEEAGVKEFHASIKWNKTAKHFELSSNSSNESDIYFYDNKNELHLKDPSGKITSMALKNQQKFRTGMVEWIVAPIPQRRQIIARLFDAIRHKNIEELREIWLEAKSWNEHLHRLHINKSAKSQFFIDSSIEEDPDYILINEDVKRFPKASDSCNEMSGGRNNRLFSSGDKPEKSSLLHVAVDYSFLDGVKFLLEKGAVVNKQCGTSKQSPLHISVRRNNLDITRQLLYYGADLELTDSLHLSAVALAETYSIRKILLSSLMLCAAADGGDFDEVKRLVEAGTSPNAKALSHKAPLHLASLNGHVKVVEFLLENKALINAIGGRRHRTALHYASLANNVEVVKVLMKYNADQEIIDSMGYTALNLSNGGEICRMLHQNPLSLCLASQAGDVEEVRSILEAQSLSRKTSTNEAYLRRISRTTSGRKISHNVAESNFGLCLAVDQRNVQGHAPLHLASAAGNLELVQLLVSYGAWVDLPGGLDKWTALFYAALAGHSEVVGFLLAIGADPHIVDAHGLTVEEHVEQNIEDMKEKLDRKGFRELSFDQDASSQEPQTLLAPAQLHRQRSDSSLDNKGQRSWMKKQVGRLEHVLSVLQSGQQKLLNALEKKDMQLLKDVLENEDVKINEPLSKHTQTTALCLAAVSGMPEFVRVLLKHNADPKVSDGQCFTPLHAAAKAGHEDVIQVLLKNGVDKNIRTNSMKQTPLHIAALHCHIDVVKLLVHKGADRAAEDIEGRTPFDMVQDLDIKELLATGNNLLYVAIARGDFNVVSQQIKEHKTPIDITFTTGLSPLQVACSHERADIVEFLISQQADVNFQGGQNASSPLHLAVQGKSTEIAKMLVENGAKLSAKDANGKTPFEVAKSNSMRKVLVDAKPYIKSELLRLEEQNADSSSDEDLSRKNLCRICFDNPANTIILPCGHQAFCKDCASHLEMCAFDRRPISQVVTVFRVAED